MDTMARTRLLNLLDDRLDMPEARDLAFSLNVDWDNLTGETKRERLRELIQYHDRRNQIPNLLRVVTMERPDLLSSYLTLLSIPYETASRGRMTLLTVIGALVPLSVALVFITYRLAAKQNAEAA